MRKNKHHDDLMWFFNNAHSAAGGPRSNFQSSMSGIRTLDFEPSDANLEAVARERRIRRAVAKTNHELVLLKRDLEEMRLEHGPTIVMSAPPPVES